MFLQNTVSFVLRTFFYYTLLMDVVKFSVVSCMSALLVSYVKEYKISIIVLINYSSQARKICRSIQTLTYFIPLFSILYSFQNFE